MRLVGAILPVFLLVLGSGCAAPFSVGQLKGAAMFGEVDLGQPGPPRGSDLGGTVVEEKPGVWRVTYKEGSQIREDRNLVEARIIYAEGTPARPIAVLATYWWGDKWYWQARRNVDLPLDFLGWSSTLGCIYSTSTPGFFLAEDREPESRIARVVCIRVLREEAAWSSRVFGSWTPWSAMAGPLKEAVGRKDFAAARTILGSRPRPAMGTDVRLIEEVWETLPSADFSELARRIDAPKPWLEQLRLYDEVQQGLERIEKRAEAEKIRDDPDLSRPELMPRPSARIAADVARYRELLDRVVKGRIQEDFAKGRIATASVHGMTFWGSVVNPSDQDTRVGMAMNVLNAYYPYVESPGYSDRRELIDQHMTAMPVTVLGASQRRESRRGADRFKLQRSDVRVTELETQPVKIREQVGAWVAATPEQIKAQKLADAEWDRLVSEYESTQRRLSSLWDSPLGQEQKGAPGIRVVERTVVNGRTLETVVTESPQNTYRLGIFKDINERKAVEARLLERQASLRGRVQDGKRPERKVVNGMVWDSRAGGIQVSDGHRYRGIAKREIALLGWVQVRTDECLTLSGVEKGTISEVDLRVRAGLEFANATQTSSDYHRLMELGVRAVIDRQHFLLSGAKVEGADEERDWALWFMGLGEPPDPRVADLVLRLWANKIR